jgi:hypothetical protein
MAGYVAWYYEHTGMHPMVIGHSMGAMQTNLILHVLNGEYSHHLTVWNPQTGEPETRDQITDPLLGTPRSVAGLKVAYASALAAGGMARLVRPTGFCSASCALSPTRWKISSDTILGWTQLAAIFLDSETSMTTTQSARPSVRTVSLPFGAEHFSAPVVRLLAETPGDSRLD